MSTSHDQRPDIPLIMPAQTADPQECPNFAANPEHSAEVTRWRDHLIAQLKDRAEGFTDGEKLMAGRPYPDLIQASWQQI